MRTVSTIAYADERATHKRLQQEWPRCGDTEHHVRQGRVARRQYAVDQEWNPEQREDDRISSD